MFAPSPSSLTATGSHTIADHFPGNQERVGLFLLRSCFKKLESGQREPFSHPVFPSPFFPGTKRRALPSSGSGRTLGELGKSFLFSEPLYPSV